MDQFDDHVSNSATKNEIIAAQAIMIKEQDVEFNKAVKIIIRLRSRNSQLRAKIQRNAEIAKQKEEESKSRKPDWIAKQLNYYMALFNRCFKRTGYDAEQQAEHHNALFDRYANGIKQSAEMNPALF